MTPFWLRAEPYRVTLRPGESAEVALHLRNFCTTPQRHRIALHAPPGWVIEPAVLEGELAGESRGTFPVRITACRDAAPGTHLVALDATLDDHRYGELFDLIVGIGAAQD